MPRKPDPHLEDRILSAARKLFLKGGENAVSMRSLAKAARTNTPALYRRFKNRKEILAALVRRIQEDLSQVVEPSVSLQEVCQRYLEFMLAHPHEYQLVNSGLFSNVGAGRPNLELLKKRSADWLGRSPEDCIGVVLAGWALSHGTATLLISKLVPSAYEAKLRSTIVETLELLVRNVSLRQ